MLKFRDEDYDNWQTCQLFIWTYKNQTTSWLVHSWNIFGARTSHGQTQTRKTHHGLNLRETTTFPFRVFFVLGHKAGTQMSSCPKTLKLKVSKFPKLGLLRFWRPIILCADLLLKCSLKQSYIFRRNFSNGMWHATYTQVNKGNFRLLMVKSQIGSLTLGPSFGHNFGHASPFQTYMF
jgi:hypothetical protein